MLQYLTGVTNGTCRRQATDLDCLAAVTAAVVVLRTLMEDLTLQNELDGYPDYVRRVRYRLVPVIW